MKQGIIGGLAALALTVPAVAEDKPAHEPSPGEIVAAAPKADWVAIASDDLLVMDLAPDRDGAKREVVIQLLPPPFSQGWVDNIRTLARAHWWDGTSVYRVQDDYVAQWGGGDDKPEPKGLKVVPESDYVARLPADRRSASEIRQSAGWATGRADPYLAVPDFRGVWPLARQAPGEPIYYVDKNGHRLPDPLEAVWPVHCYGTVGVARGTDNTGSGAELYAVIGQAPRQLDRNIALAGRVIEGMENLSSLPRGHGELGFYS